MKPDSFKYLGQFEEVFEIAHRSGYVRTIPVRKLKRLISIYEEITGAKSGYNAHNMCRNGGSCLTAFMLELRVEYLAQKDGAGETPVEKPKAVKMAKKAKEKNVELKTEKDGRSKERSADEV